MFEEKVTMFRSVTETKSPVYVKLDKVFDRIRQGKSKDLVEKIRNGERKLKRELPVVLFSGIFESRQDDALHEHSGLIVLDFDHVDVTDSKSFLATDKYVLACWASPSGDGLKALVKVTNPDMHRDHYRSLTSYFEKTYGLEVDPTGINESRACYESYDPDIAINTMAVPFGGMSSERSLDQKATLIESKNLTDYNKVNILASMIRNAIDGEKHHVLYKAAVLAGGYISAGRMEEDEVMRVITRELERKEIEDMPHAIRTLEDGIRVGKERPIRETMEEEAAAMREMAINDGDMSFMSNNAEDYKYITDFVHGKIDRGLTTGCPSLDPYFLFKREFVVIVGHTNVGKTTMALYLLVASAINHGWRWIIYSSENKTASVKMRLMEYALNKSIDQMTELERRHAFDFVSKHFTIINNYSTYGYADIIVFVEKLLRQSKYDGVFVDPYNSLRIELGKSQLSTHEYHYQAASEFLTMSVKHDVAVWLNTHSVTGAQRAKGGDGMSVAPTGADAEGGSKFANRADSLIVWHRKVNHPDKDIRETTEFHVKKQRNQDTGGQPTPLDQPILLKINPGRTQFKTWVTHHSFFQPLDIKIVQGSLSY